jgi:O-antigen/teichoic acid export membrane protein
MVAACTGAVGAAFIFFGSEAFTTRWLNISASISGDVLASLLIISLAIVPVAINTAIRGTLEGLNRFAAANLNRSIVGTMMFLLPVLAIHLGDASLATVSLYLLAGRIGLAIVSIAQVWRELTGPEYRHVIRQGSFLSDIANKIRQLLRYGIWIAVTGVVGPLMTSGDRFVIVKFVNAGLMPAYIIPQEGLQKLLLLPAALFGALFPRMSERWDEETAGLFWKYYKWTAIGMAVVCAAAAAASYPILQFWISDAFAAQAYPIAVVLCFGIWINSLAQAPYTLLHARGRPKMTAIFHMIELFFYFAVLIIFLDLFGLVGAAYAWVSRVVLDLLLLHFAVLHILKEDMPVS